MAVDYIEVSRKAQELSEHMGPYIGLSYAAKLAAEAIVNGATEEGEFWRAVELAMTPRQRSSDSAKQNMI